MHFDRTCSQLQQQKSPGDEPGLSSMQADQHLTTLAGLADHAFEPRDPPSSGLSAYTERQCD